MCRAMRSSRKAFSGDRPLDQPLDGGDPQRRHRTLLPLIEASVDRPGAGQIGGHGVVDGPCQTPLPKAGNRHPLSRLRPQAGGARPRETCRQ